MPRVNVRTYDAADFDHSQGLARGVEAFGHALAGGIRDRASSRAKAAELKLEAEAQDRKFKIEEAKAAAALAKEENEAAARGEVQAQKQAERDQASEDYQKATARSSEDALRQDVGAALRRSGGVLGPFGILNPKTMLGGLQRQAAIGKKMQANKEQASRMTPVAARNFLTKQAEELKKEVNEAGFNEEFELLDALSVEEKIDPARAKEYAKELQRAAREGGPPGAIHKRLMEESELYVQAQTRAEDWEKADVSAKGMIDGLRKLVGEMPDGLDPITGKSAKAEMMKRLAAAGVEWNRTRPGENGVSVFRQKNDAAGSLDGLQKILFEAQIEADPDAFMRQERSANTPMTKPPAERDPATDGVGPLGAEVPPGGGGARPSQAAQEAPTGGPRRAGGGGQPVADRTRQQIATMVMEGAQDALRAGKPEARKKALRALLERLKEDLGVNPGDPSVLAIVQEALAQASAPMR